jgi:hypothetical protein
VRQNESLIHEVQYVGNEYIHSKLTQTQSDVNGKCQHKIKMSAYLKQRLKNINIYDSPLSGLIAAICPQFYLL